MAQSPQGNVILHPILNLENLEKIKSSLTMDGKEMTPEALMQYFNFVGCNIDPDKLQLVVKAAKEIHTRYSDYRNNPEEYVYIPQSMSEFQGLKPAEQMYGGKSFALSIYDIIKIIADNEAITTNLLHDCIRKDSVYLNSFIKSLEANNIDSVLDQPIYGFYKDSISV
jgi:ribosomal protein L12E/L44/L45/RPP1/RPP2